MAVGIFIDNSGSTLGQWQYHQVVEHVVKQTVATHEHVRCAYWNDECQLVSAEKVLANSTGPRRGQGGTNIDSILKLIQGRMPADTHFEKLILITDGQVDGNSVLNAMRFIQEYGRKWDSVEAHIVSPHPNTTVIAPFIRDVPYAVHATKNTKDGYQHGVHSLCLVSLKQVIELMESIDTEQSFLEKFETLRARVAADTIGAQNTAARDAILAMRARLVKSMSPAGDVPATVEGVRAAASRFYAAPPESLNKADQLLALCDAVGDYGMERLRGAWANRQQAAPDAPALEDLEDVAEDCKVIDHLGMFEDAPETPILLFKAGDPILSLADVEEMKEIARNPLKLLTLGGGRYAKEIQRRALPPHGRDTLIECAKSWKIGVSPDTRETMMREVFVFGPDQAHVDANKACISNLIFGTNKFSGSYGVWMVVMWHLLGSCEYVRSVAGPSMDAFMRDFVANTPDRFRVFMGLSGTGQRPTARVSLASALLYALVSSDMWSDVHADRDVLRDLYGSFDAIRAALELAGVEADYAAYGAKADALKVAASLLYRIKRESSRALMIEVCSTFMETLRMDDGQIFLLDGLASQPTDKARLQYTLLATGAVDASKKFSAVRIPQTLLDPVQHLNIGRNFAPAENALTSQPDFVKVCPKTLRPYARVFYPTGAGNCDWVDWEVPAVRVLGEDRGAWVSLYKFLAGYFYAHRRFPSDPASVATFLKDLQQSLSHKKCLPLGIMTSIRDCVSSLEDAMKERVNAGDAEAARRDIAEGACRKTRIEMETAWRQSRRVSVSC